MFKNEIRMIYLIIVALIISISGCKSENPLSDIIYATYDDRLNGIWRPEEDDNDAIHYHIGHKISDESYQLMYVAGVEHRSNGDLDVAVYDVFHSKLNEINYLNVVNPDGSYIFIKYSFVSKNKIMICVPDMGVIKLFVDKGDLAADTNDIGEVVIFTDSTEKLAKLFAQKYFVEKVFHQCDAFIKIETESSKK